MAAEVLVNHAESVLPETSSSSFYSLEEYLLKFGHTPEILWHIENIEFGVSTIFDQINPQELTDKFSEYKEDKSGLRHVAKHEAGHFIAGEKLGLKPRATTIPDDDSLGKTWYDNLTIDPTSVNNLRNIIALSLAGGHGANSNKGTGSDHGKANSIAKYLSVAHKEGEVHSILSSGHSEARRLSGRGTRRFMQVERILSLKRNISS